MSQAVMDRKKESNQIESGSTREESLVELLSEGTLPEITAEIDLSKIRDILGEGPEFVEPQVPELASVKEAKFLEPVAGTYDGSPCSTWGCQTSVGCPTPSIRCPTSVGCPTPTFRIPQEEFGSESNETSGSDEAWLQLKDKFKAES